MASNNKALHVVMFPWLAFGHLIPFLELAKHIAQKNHKVSFVSTPRNIARIPKIFPNLPSFITFVPIPLPQVENLPANAESATDVPYHKQQLLKKAFDLLQYPFNSFLESTKVDWIIYDYASHWLPELAAQHGISRAFFSLFNAAVMAIIGPPSALLEDGNPRMSVKELTTVPNWVPFETGVVYRSYEITRILESVKGNESGTADTIRFGVTIKGSDVVVVRSSPEMEPEWFSLLEELYEKPVVPIGFLPPTDTREEEDDEEWTRLSQWLDRQRVNSVVYVAMGSEVSLRQEELNELAVGLQKSKLPFIWALRRSTESNQHELDRLPEGFIEQVKGRGLVLEGWAPQLSILRHESTGGFLSHCGWNSVIEGLGAGRVLILLPIVNDQGLNARLLSERGLGVEIPRDEEDGSFKSDSVAETIQRAMMELCGESLRNRAKMKNVFGRTPKNDYYLNKFVDYLQDPRLTRA